ncbi:MAG: hypothetical protein M1832_003903 [Thelocarpon impressellum]|nr:MAG: hypothetical protein M1832_003903 [Thelocarpon impressellum]
MSDAKSAWPPKAGSPVWLEVPAVDVQRAKTFFTAALDWEFKAAGEGYPEDQITMITFTDPAYPTLSGGIVKVDAAGFAPGKHVAPVFYLFVPSIDDSLERIKKAGGKVVEEKKPEGKTGLTAKFSDTEGNVHGLYALLEGCGEA